MINMDFSYETEVALRKNLHWGDIDFEELFKDAGVPTSRDLIDDIGYNKHAQCVFRHWMKNKLSKDQAFLVRVNYGKGRFPKNIDIPEAVFDSLHPDNEIRLKIAFEALRENMTLGRCLYHLMTGYEIGFDGYYLGVPDDIKVNYRDQWLNLVSLFGLRIVNGDNLNRDSVFRCIADRFDDEIMSAAIYFALSGNGEIVYDKKYRIFGIDADSIYELYEKCWEYCVKPYLTKEIIAEGLKKFLNVTPNDCSNSQIIYEAAYALYIFGEGVRQGFLSSYPDFKRRGWKEPLIDTWV